MNNKILKIVGIIVLTLGIIITILEIQILSQNQPLTAYTFIQALGKSGAPIIMGLMLLSLSSRKEKKK